MGTTFVCTLVDRPLFSPVMNGSGYISTSSINLVEVAVSLIEQLDQRERVPPNQVQTSGTENGVAATVVILAAVVVEGWVNRLRYFEDMRAGVPRIEDPPDQGRQTPEHPLDWLSTRIPDDLHRKCEEVFCARDVLVHGHSWHARTEPAPLRFVEAPVLHDRFGDRRFRRVIDPRTRRSGILHLNLFPTRIWRRDAYLAFQTTVKVIEALEPIDATRHRVANLGHYSFKNEDLLLSDIAASLVVPEDPLDR